MPRRVGAGPVQARLDPSSACGAPTTPGSAGPGRICFFASVAECTAGSWTMNTCPCVRIAALIGNSVGDDRCRLPIQPAEVHGLNGEEVLQT